MNTITRAVLTAATGIVLALTQGGPAAASDASIAAGCSGSACDGRNPSTLCQGDATTLESLRLGGVALLELRYSRSCRAAWARISNALNDGQNFASVALVHRNSDGREYGCSVPRGSSSCFTLMVNDANVTSFAYGEWDGGVLVYRGQTASR